MKTVHVGDQVAATVSDTSGQTVEATLRVNKTTALGCGCVRLACDRPGPTPRRNGVHLLTGCRIHDRTVS